MRHRVRFHPLTMLALLAGATIASGADSPATLPATEPAGQSPSTAPAALPALSTDELALLHRLESPNWRDRKAAEKELDARSDLDANAIQAMLAATKSPEAQGRLNALLARLADNDLIGPSPITLHVKDAPAGDVYGEIFRQAHATLMPSPDSLFSDPANPLPKLTVDVDRQPFWEVIRKLSDTTGMIPTRLSGSDIILLKMPLVGVQQDVSGCAMFNLTGSTIVSRGKKQDDPHQLFLRAMTMVEPKVTIAQVFPSAKVDSAIDDHGNSLVPPDNDQVPMLFTNRPNYGWWPVLIPLQVPAKNPGTRIADVKGMIHVVVLSKMDHQEIDHLLTAPAQPLGIGKLSAGFVRCAKTNTGCTVTLSVRGEDERTLFSLIGFPRGNLRVLDANGAELPHASISAQIQQGGDMQVAVTFVSGAINGGKPIGEPVKLVTDIFSETRDLQIPFEFKDLDLKALSQPAARK